jgi:hypothetical protein
MGDIPRCIISTCFFGGYQSIPPSQHPRIHPQINPIEKSIQNVCPTLGTMQIPWFWLLRIGLPWFWLLDWILAMNHGDFEPWYPDFQPWIHGDFEPWIGPSSSGGTAAAGGGRLVPGGSLEWLRGGWSTRMAYELRLYLYVVSIYIYIYIYTPISIYLYHSISVSIPISISISI